MIKILHIADVHLDHPFGSHDKHLREILTKELYKSFEKAVSVAVDESVDAFLIAGDLFHSDTMTFHSERMLRQAFEKLSEKGIMCVYATGNHDPKDQLGRFLSMELPGVHILGDDEIQCIDCISNDGSPFRIIGCGHGSKDERRQLINKYPVRGDVKTIGIGHTMISHIKVDGKEPYMPVELDELIAKKYDYFALGHIHKREVFNDTIAYSGSIQGLSHKEQGPKGGHLITLDGYGTQISFVELSKIRWQTVDVNITGLETLKQIENLVLNQAKKYGGLQTLLRVNLKGETNLNAIFEDENLQVMAEDLTLEGFLDVSVRCEGLQRAYKMKDAILEDEFMKSILVTLEETSELMESLLSLEVFRREGFDKEYLESFIDNNQNEIKLKLMEYVVRNDG